MQHPYTFLQLTLPRLATMRKRLDALLWDVAHPIAVHQGPSTSRRLSLSQARDRRGEFTPATVGQPVGETYGFTWYRLELPPDRPNGCFLRWRHAGESTVYVGDECWAGFDRQHEHHRLPDAAEEAWMEVMHMQAGQALAEAAVVTRNDLAWKVRVDLDVLMDVADLDTRHLAAEYGGAYTKAFTYRPSPEFLPRFTRRLLRLLDEAALALEKRGLEAMSDKLDDALAEFKADEHGLKLVATAHAHLDPIFQWPEPVGDFKTVHTFATADRLMSEYPQLTFQFSQPVLYDKVAELEPDLSRRVGERLRQGRWEMEGVLYSESDVQMPCGEALARAMLLGREATRNHAGKSPEVVWLPDTFGFPACLPQIIDQCGGKYFWTTKMQWSPITHFPYSSFRWAGNDGTHVLAHLAQHHMGYCLNALPSQIRNLEKIHRQSDVHDESIATIGMGDGGGGITAEEIERVGRIENLYSVPRTRFGSVGDFFRRMDALAENLPEYRGELYLEYHRGTLTTRRRMKQRYRACERALLTLEAVHVAKGLGPVDQQPWKRLALMQFHDVLPGSSIEQVYQAVEAELERMETDLLDEARRLLNDETDQGPTCLFNPLPVQREFWWSDPRSGQARRIELPPLSGVDVDAAAIGEAPDVAADAEGMGSDRVEVRFDRAGRVRSLIVDGRELRLTAPGNQLILYRELPAMFDVWDIDQQSLVEGQALTGPADVEVTDAGPIDRCVAFTHHVGPSRITVRYRLLPGEPVLRIEYDVDWRHTQTLLKTHWPTDYQGAHARFGCPFGSFLRPAQPGRDREQAMWEVGASRWACVFDEGEREGLAVITESSYGFSCRSGEMTASLIRSPMRPECDMQRLGEVLLPDGADYGAKTAPEMFTDLGQHTIRLAVGACDASAPLAELPAVLAETLYTPPVRYQGSAFGGPMPRLAGGGTLAPCWARPLEDGSWELRLHEVQGRHGRVELTGGGASPARKTTLDGRALGQCDPATDYRPFEIVTLRLPPRSSD